jgi:tetratricopeptide (TPR) repeat protein
MQRPAPLIIAPPAGWLQQYPHLTAQTKQLAADYKNQSPVDDATLQTIGTALWDALQLGDALDSAKQAAGEQTVAIVVETDDAAILALPWETLYHPHYGFLGREVGFTLSRRNPSVTANLPEVRCEPLRVLLFTSIPDDLGEMERLDVEAEQVAIQQALMDCGHKGTVLLEMPDDGRLETLRDTLHAFQPHLVYLSGHGDFTLEHHNQQAYGSFLFEDAWGKGKRASETELVACFAHVPVQLLILSACLSAKQHPNYPANGLSAALYRSGIPHVIGMGESVIDEAATQFASILLQTLAARETVGIALQRARAAMSQITLRSVYWETKDPLRTALSYGQWCLPQLLSHGVTRQLVDWQFTPQPQEHQPWQNRQGEVALPERFIGRRRELRQWQNRLCSPALNCLLITGAGGIGKTALASKLLATLENDGYQTFTLSFRPQHLWQDALTRLENLFAQQNGKLALFFDSLEWVQDGHAPHAIHDLRLQNCLENARRLSGQGLKLILTSRLRLPNWADSEHFPLGKPVYGDYVALARLHHLPLFGAGLTQAYQAFGGNFRALECFAKATQGMAFTGPQAFVDALGKAAVEAQTDMALASIIAQRNAPERELLHRLLAYQTAVPLEGVNAIGEAAGHFLPQLLAVSLVEQPTNPHTHLPEYQLAPLVRSWLLANGTPVPAPAFLQTAAEFLLQQLQQNPNPVWEQRLATHAALQAAHLDEKRQRLVLDWIVEPLVRAGMYRALLGEWLHPLAEAENPRIRARALREIGSQYYYLDDYEPARQYLAQALALYREIGDKPGESAALNNISQVFKALGNYDTALDYLQQALAIQRQTGNKPGEGRSLSNIAQILKVRGDYPAALGYLQQALAIQQQVNDKLGVGTTLSTIAQLHEIRGDYDAAFSHLKQALTIQQQIGDKSGENSTLNNLGTLAQTRGDYDTALDYLQQSLAIQRRIGDKFGESRSLNNLATIAHARGDDGTALKHLQQAITIRQRIGDREGLSYSLLNIAAIYWRKGEHDEAKRAWLQAYRIARQINLAEVLKTLAKWAKHIGLPDGERGWEMLALQVGETCPRP